jgi:hypothetical protein
MKNSRNGFWLRDQRGKEIVLVLVLVLESDSTRTRTRKQKRLQFRKTGMKAFDESWRKQIVRQVSSFSLRRSAPNVGPTSAFKPVS